MISAAIPAYTSASLREAGLIVARYTMLAIGVTLALTLVLAAFGPPPETASAVIMLAVVALVGLPHGAYDLDVARRLFSPRLGRGWWIIFCAAYLALVLLGLGLWATAPALGLLALLVGGAAHWGLDDLDDAPRGSLRTAWLAVSRGAVPVAAPMAFHSAEVAAIFSTLLGTSISSGLVRPLGVAWLIASIPGIVASVYSRAARPARVLLRIIGEPIVLLLWFAFAPPILGFTLYFCFWHASRHSLRSALAAKPGDGLGHALGAYARAAAWPTVLTWLLAAGAAAIFLRSEPLVEASWSVIFIGLFALAVPHVALEIFEHRASQG